MKRRTCISNGLLVAAMVLMSASLASAQSGAGETRSCADIFFNDESPARPRGLRLDLPNACVRFTGEINNNFQQDLSTPEGRASAHSGQGSTTPKSIDTTIGYLNVDTKSITRLGDLTTNMQVQWLKATNDGTDLGTATIQSLYGSMNGVTAGYTSSLMNFWGGDFLFTASTPNISVGIVSYEAPLNENFRIAAAVESGLPSSQQTSLGIASLNLQSPTVTGRLRYFGDDGLVLHLSGVVRQAEFPANTTSPLFSSSAATRTGWAPSFGASVPLRFLGQGDVFSMQATYAVNALQVLGTKADIGRLESILPSTGPTSGWSVVGSLHHVWSSQFQSNAFASYISAGADLIGTRPAVHTTRLDANIYWFPVEQLRLGAEIGWVRTELAANGAEGLLSGVSGTALVGYLSAKLRF